MSDLKEPNIRAGGEAFKSFAEGLSNAIKKDKAIPTIQERIEAYFALDNLSYTFFVEDEEGIHIFKTKKEAIDYFEKRKGVLR